MAEHVPPYDERSENALIGAMLLNNSVIDEVQRIATAADFYQPRCQTLFYEIVQIWKEGSKVDPVILADRLKTHGMLDRIGGPAELISFVSNAPATSTAPKWAEIIVAKAMLRRAIGIGNELTQRAYANPEDPQQLLEEAIAALQAANVAKGVVPEAVWTLDDYLNQPPEDQPEWIIEDVIREGWRIMLVAAEGSGKTTLFRQIAICTAQGIHPFLHSSMPPQRTLIVDCENPQDSIVDMCTPIRDEAERRTRQDYDPNRAWLWWKPGGIDLRSRSDRIRFEAVIEHVKPKLVCIGPVYKIYQVNARENDELAAREVMAVLDDLRTRYRFGLMMEHHAPKATGSKREMMPFGTSLWLRWPELGISMMPLNDFGDEHSHREKRQMKIGRWRGDRLANEWPVELHESTPWPWQGVYPTGTYPVQTPHTTKPSYSPPPPHEPETPEPEEEPERPDTQAQMDLLEGIVEGGVVQGYGPDDQPF